MFLYLIKSCGHANNYVGDVQIHMNKAQANLLGCSKYVNKRYSNGGESVRDSPIVVNRIKF